MKCFHFLVEDTVHVPLSMDLNEVQADTVEINAEDMAAYVTNFSQRGMHLLF